MSITLKRPMFRRGGEVNEGIMELAKPRRNFSTGTEIEEIFETSGLSPSGRSYAETAMKLANLGKPSDADLLTNILIQGGLRGMSTAGKGGTLANLASAFEAPVGQALKARQAGKTLGVAGAMKGLELGIKKDVADKAIEAKLGKKQFESGTDAARIKQMLDLLGGSAMNQRDVFNASALSREDIRGQNLLGSKYRGIALPDTSDRTRLSKAFLDGQNEGDILLHPFTRKFVIVKKEPTRTEPIDQETLKEITEEG